MATVVTVTSPNPKALMRSQSLQYRNKAKDLHIKKIHRCCLTKEEMIQPTLSGIALMLYPCQNDDSNAEEDTQGQSQDSVRF